MYAAEPWCSDTTDLPTLQPSSLSPIDFETGARNATDQRRSVGLCPQIGAVFAE